MRRLLTSLALYAALTATASAATSAVATGAVNVRTGPGTGHQRVDTLHQGERVRVIKCDGNWCRIRHPGPDGWVSIRYLAPVRSVTVWRFDDPCDVDPVTEFHLRFGLYHTPLAKYCRERDD